MRWSRALVVATLAILAAACGERTGGPEAPPASGEPSPEYAVRQMRASAYLDSTARTEQEQLRVAAADAAPAPAGANRPVAAPPGSNAGALDALWAEQKLIRDGRIEVEVENVEATVERIGAVAAGRRALVAGSEVRKGADGSAHGTVTLKVPAGGFDGLVADLRELGRVRGESTATQDVTKAYTDLEARLEVKRRTRARLEAILAGRAGSLDELLRVEREIERVVTEIERMEGERRYYDQRVAVSTLTIVLFEPGSAVRPGAFAPVAEAMRGALGVLATSIAALVFVTMSALPWVAVAWLLWTLVRRARRRRAARSAD